MDTNSNISSSAPKMTLVRQDTANGSYKQKISANSIIIIMGILFSALFYIARISWINMDWKIPFIPLMVALQIIFLSTALKNRSKKL
ncbi:MAG TPA: hypothetical protein VLR29_00880 [Flavobacterium sp.]|nr:hypothetical protein [Flavobacterium sp.]